MREPIDTTFLSFTSLINNRNLPYSENYLLAVFARARVCVCVCECACLYVCLSVCVCAACGCGCVRMGVCCISIIIYTHIINIKGMYECGFV